uniref:hypothetical protein n=1 Tax=Lactarius subindigo TaxID=457120 RepID=UPI002551CF58|nr:hypothetical protein QQQ02_mgp03 [Lactarius subindigo]WGL35952.1 hypothetical protein [Lactarius subindigo]
MLGCSLFYLIRNNYTAISSKNIEALTNEEIEAIVNENAVTIINNENIDAIIDSDSDYDTDVASDYQSTSDDESIIDLNDLDLFFMPDVDFNICSIQELKFFEISSIYSREIAAKAVSDEQLMDLICSFPERELLTNTINELILLIITYT